MSDWNKDMSESMMKLFAYKKDYLGCDNIFSLPAERANGKIVLILTLMCRKHGMGFVKILLVNTGLQEVYKVCEEE
tara:strand:+ start:1487 stop:1714 length:228 start_codon:yes stop_codon:yes gene_type:complete